MAYLDDVDPETFDYRSYAQSRLPASYSELPWALKREVIIRATVNDPLLFAILVFSKTISGGGNGEITFADMHFDLCRIARHFAKPLDPVNPIRMAFLAPRRAGKTTWLYKILSFWMACHGHRKFFFVLNGKADQAQLWIKNFKLEMQRNTVLQEVWPELCRPMKREATGSSLADDANLYMAENGFIIGARSADSNNLGLNVGDERPDFILFDDIEPPGGSYSLYQMEQKLKNVHDAIPMGSEGATVVFVGTVLMPGSIMDQIREFALKPDPKSWVSEISLKVRHYKPFVDRNTGEESTTPTPNTRSFWPGRHNTESLMKMVGTRIFASQYANEPVPVEGAYWREGSIKPGTIPKHISTITAIVLDPAVTTKKKSDFSAIVVIRYAPSLGLFEVLYGRAFKLPPGVELPVQVAQVHVWYPEATLLMVDVTHGKDLWTPHFNDIPGLHFVPITLGSADGGKTQRAVPVLRMYETGHVVHSTEDGASTGELEREMYSFPKGLHDDLPDAACFGVLNLMKLYGGDMAQGDEELLYI